MTPVEKLQAAERMLIEVRDDEQSPYSAHLISRDALGLLKLGCHTTQTDPEEEETS